MLSFYENIFNIGVHTDGVQIHRVRVRANAVFCQNMCDSPVHPTGQGRIAPWSDQACGAGPLGGWGGVGQVSLSDSVSLSLTLSDSL
eukprot:COSAG03_NODE_1432_length_4089_cov_11.519298_6_plen_87_part_00